MRCFTASGLACVIAFAALAVSTNVAYGALYTDASQFPTLHYDFVVIGGTNPDFFVLVIEAVPFLALANLPYSSVTWNYSTTPQASLNNRVLSYPRGRVLGGSTSINLMTYTPGSDDEYNRWAELTGNDYWAWKNLAPFYFKSSRLVPPVDNHSTAGLVDPADHGFGPVEVSLPGLPSELDGRVVNASKASGAEFPFNIDMQSGNSVGVSIVQSTIGGGIRSSSSRAYLEPHIHRKNLHVLIQNTVTRLVKSGSSDGVPIFKQVEFAPSWSAKRKIVTANKEVVLSAGSIGTPQILMLSGIGDATELKPLGIKPVVNLPDVGKNLQDHPIMSNYWVVNSNNTFDDVLRNASIFNADLAQWLANKTGLFSNSFPNAVAFLRIPRNASIFKSVRDPSAGSCSAHFEMIWGDGYGATVVPQPGTGHFVTIYTAVVSPTSVGSVRLASADPFTFPLINPNFFNTSFDQFAMLSAVKAARAFMATRPWRGFVVSRFGPVGTAETDQDIIAAARDAIVTIWHPTSTARMSPKNASWGVVDPQLLVKGVSGLRIVDASVIPIIPAAHTSAPTYILAERAAEFIKRAWY
ncbi:aryl-alcohol oxidase-like protein [Trametes punicea]|nr:aryl-alcohol oxidase-like protein [Trametes punicea]